MSFSQPSAIGHYVLDDEGQPLLLEDGDWLAWAQWFEHADRHIGKDELLPTDVWVSTVFLGLDHAFGGGTPILFETMIFGGPLDQEQDRYATREEALIGHAEWLAKAQQANTFWRRLRWHVQTWVQEQLPYWNFRADWRQERDTHRRALVSAVGEGSLRGLRAQTAAVAGARIRINL